MALFLKASRKDEVKVGLNLAIDGLSHCSKCYFWVQGEELQGKNGQEVCAVYTFCSSNFVVKDFCVSGCQFYSHLNAHG